MMRSQTEKRVSCQEALNGDEASTEKRTGVVPAVGKRERAG
jgi:hypothetical protein